jgi:hypothetical protein
MCISASFDVSPNYNDYDLNFTFFLKVPLIFYFFLMTSVLSLSCLILYTKNKYFILLSISLFIFCLWILPYIQIGSYFGQDSLKLFKILDDYSNYGIKNVEGFHFIIYLEGFAGFVDGFVAFRYSTSVFTGLLLIFSTGVDINFALWYLYPLIFIFTPFLFYSIFKKFSNKEEDNNSVLIILALLALFTTQFLKNAHSATTGVIGIYIFFILILEFYELMENLKSKNVTQNIVIILFLYIFLCLTHLEECIYFLVLVILYMIYYSFMEIKNINRENSVNLKIYKNNFKKLAFLIVILTLIFYLSQEFFGYFEFYLYSFDVFIPISPIYLYTRIMIFGYNISIFVIGVIFIGYSLFFIILYRLVFNSHSTVYRLYLKFLNKFKSLFNLFKKVISKRIVQAMIFPIFWGGILLINFFFYPFIQEQGIFIMVEIILSYTLIIFHIFLFLKGILYYKIKRNKQNFFLISIISTSIILFTLLIMGNIPFSFYILNSRFFTYFIFFNLVIIQNNYFREFIDKRKIYLILLLISILLLGTFYSLRKLAWG